MYLAFICFSFCIWLFYHLYISLFSSFLVNYSVRSLQGTLKAVISPKHIYTILLFTTMQSAANKEQTLQSKKSQLVINSADLGGLMCGINTESSALMMWQPQVERLSMSYTLRPLSFYTSSFQFHYALAFV